MPVDHADRRLHLAAARRDRDVVMLQHAEVGHELHRADRRVAAHLHLVIGHPEPHGEGCAGANRRRQHESALVPRASSTTGAGFPPAGPSANITTVLASRRIPGGYGLGAKPID